MTGPTALKLWFNRRFPYHRKCHRAGCWRTMSYQYRCPRHQDDNWPA